MPTTFITRKISWCVAAVCLISAVALSQPARRAHKTGRKQEPTKNDIQFMDVRLFGFDTLEYVAVHGTGAANGPNTTIESTDSQSGTKSRLRTPHLKAIGDPKTGKATRFDATGGVNYEGQRPMVEGGIQTIQFTGTKGTWFRKEGRVALDGPVSYYGEQPVPPKPNEAASPEKSKEWIRGTADRATYDEEKHLLVLDGSVRFTVFVPGLNDKPQPPAATDRLTVDMSKTPYMYRLEGGAVTGELKTKPKQDKKNP